MKINKIIIQNFKGFEYKEFSFNPNMTVLIGDNGQGKTSILDALSFVLGTFFLGVDGVPNRRLKESEKRRVIVSPESFEIQLPFKISVEHTLLGENYEWFRDTDKATGRSTSYKNAKELINKAEEMTNQVRTGQPVFLPLIAYFGVTRLSEKQEIISYTKQSSRLDGYYNALDSSSFQRKFLEWFKTFEDAKLKFDKDDGLYKAFTNAITGMIPNWKNIHFSWEADDMLGQLDNGEWMPFEMLSDGYKNIVRISADIAYRAIKLNPPLGEDAVIKTEGVVLIDEIDMHLHPKWQKTVIADFKRTFPNIQFIVTTHSPFIVQSLRADEIINLDGEIEGQPFTKSIEEIAEAEMGVEYVQRSQRFLELQRLASQYFDLIEQGKNSSNDAQTKQLKQQLDAIELEFNNDPVYIALMQAERKTEFK
ncbi:MAG: AAA family ATPase [Methylococcaceae bacterium]